MDKLGQSPGCQHAGLRINRELEGFLLNTQKILNLISFYPDWSPIPRLFLQTAQRVEKVAIRHSPCKLSADLVHSSKGQTLPDLCITQICHFN